METIKIKPEELTFSPWNVNSVSPENMSKLKESVKRNGIFRPVVVRELENGEYQVIAGEHTTRVAMELGLKTIDVYNLGQINDRKAKEISVIDNQHYGIEDTFGLGALLREIDTNPADFLPFSDYELTKIFKASEIDLESLSLPEDDDKIDLTYDPDKDLATTRQDFQIMRFKVPLKDCEFVTRRIEAIVKRQGLKDTDSMLSVGMALVHLCNMKNEESKDE
jgi:ParB family transcriptional regulator, chromosome partitioning protein